MSDEETVTEPVTANVPPRPDEVPEDYSFMGRRLCWLDRRFAFAGNLWRSPDQLYYMITNAHQLRSWADNGSGGVSRDPNAAGAKLDRAADVEVAHNMIICRQLISDTWGEGCEGYEAE